jgi:signal peptidase I
MTLTVISRSLAPQVLNENGECCIKGAGNSMQPIINTGDKIYLKKVDPSQLRKGDAVYCKVNGNKFVHLITAVDSGGKRFQISNNKGHTNGWIGPSGVYGLAVQVEDKVLVSDKELDNRLSGDTMLVL